MVLDPREAERAGLIERVRSTCAAIAELAAVFVVTELAAQALLKSLNRELRLPIRRASTLAVLEQIKGSGFSLNRRGRRAMRKKLPRRLKSLVKNPEAKT